MFHSVGSLPALIEAKSQQVQTRVQTNYGEKTVAALRVQDDM